VVGLAVGRFDVTKELKFSHSTGETSSEKLSRQIQTAENVLKKKREREKRILQFWIDFTPLTVVVVWIHDRQIRLEKNKGKI